MSNLFTLPIIKDFVMHMHTAITKFKENQATQPGSSFNGRVFLAMVLSCSLFLIGSCNEKVEILDFTENKPVLSAMTKGQMVRHSYKIQSALSQDLTIMSAFTPKELELVLAQADLKRSEGKTQIWHYFGQHCALDVYWTEKSKGDYRHEYFEFRERRGLFHNASYENKDFQDWQCFQSLVQDRREKIEANFDILYAVLDLNEQRS